MLSAALLVATFLGGIPDHPPAFRAAVRYRIEVLESVARRVQTATSYLMSGIAATPGWPAYMEAKGGSAGSYYVPNDGTLLGSIVTSIGDATVTMASAPAPIPARTTATVTLTVLK